MRPAHNGFQTVFGQFVADDLVEHLDERGHVIHGLDFVHSVAVVLLGDADQRDLVDAVHAEVQIGRFVEVSLDVSGDRDVPPLVFDHRLCEIDSGLHEEGSRFLC